MGLPLIADLSLRGLNFIFLVIVLGLTGSLIQGRQHSNSRVNFALFASAFGLVFSVFYGVLANFVQFLAWPLLAVTIEFLNLIFTFAAATALAVGTRTHSCTNQAYLDSNAIAEGSTDRCRKAQASTAFLYFSFFVILVTAGAQVVNLFTGGAFGIPTRRKSRATAGVPTISTA